MHKALEKHFKLKPCATLNADFVSFFHRNFLVILPLFLRDSKIFHDFCHSSQVVPGLCTSAFCLLDEKDILFHFSRKAQMDGVEKMKKVYACKV